MLPTPLAQNIITPVRSALQLLRGSVHDSRVFDPANAHKTFRLSMTDLSEDTLLPATFQRLHKLAPNVRIESLLARRRETAKELAAGHLDFAIDVPLNSDPQLLHTKLLEDRYVCAMRKGHPLASHKKISLEQYLATQHIHISSRRSGLGPVDLALGKMGLQRNIVLRSQHYLMAQTVLQNTDLTITAPARFVAHYNLHSVELPIAGIAPIESCFGTPVPTKIQLTAGCASNYCKWRSRSVKLQQAKKTAYSAQRLRQTKTFCKKSAIRCALSAMYCSWVKPLRFKGFRS